MSIEYPEIIPFQMPNSTPKQYALKVLEEAAELVEAVKYEDGFCMCYEFCDVLQALENLAENIGWADEDLEDAYSHVYQSNKDKGRYEGVKS